MPQLGAAEPDRPRQQSLPCWRSFNPLFRRAGSIAPPLGPPRCGLELSTGTGLYGACRSTQCCLAVWSRWVESSTRLGGVCLELSKDPRGALHYQSEQSQANQPWNHRVHALASEPLITR
jgi:hypothetical protein